jgi:hypothetical protein
MNFSFYRLKDTDVEECYNIIDGIGKVKVGYEYQPWFEGVTEKIKL